MRRVAAEKLTPRSSGCDAVGAHASASGYRRVARTRRCGSTSGARRGVLVQRWRPLLRDAPRRSRRQNQTCACSRQGRARRHSSTDARNCEAKPPAGHEQTPPCADPEPHICYRPLLRHAQQAHPLHLRPERTQSLGTGVDCIKNLSRQSPATAGARSLLFCMNTLTSIVAFASTTSCTRRKDNSTVAGHVDRSAGIQVLHCCRSQRAWGARMRQHDFRFGSTRAVFTAVFCDERIREGRADTASGSAEHLCRWIANTSAFNGN